MGEPCSPSQATTSHLPTVTLSSTSETPSTGSATSRQSLPLRSHAEHLPSARTTQSEAASELSYQPNSTNSILALETTVISPIWTLLQALHSPPSPNRQQTQSPSPSLAATSSLCPPVQSALPAQLTALSFTLHPASTAPTTPLSSPYPRLSPQATTLSGSGIKLDRVIVRLWLLTGSWEHLITTQEDRCPAA